MAVTMIRGERSSAEPILPHRRFVRIMRFRSKSDGVGSGSESAALERSLDYPARRRNDKRFSKITLGTKRESPRSTEPVYLVLDAKNEPLGMTIAFAITR